MRWKGRRQSSNVEDRRGQSAGRRRGAAMGGGLGVIILVIVVALLGGDPMSLLQQMDTGATVSQSSGPVELTAEQQQMSQFVSVVLADTEDVWNALFRQMGKQYEEPSLVLFSGSVQSACGYASAASGPFYCPADRKVYIDLVFYEELKRKFGAPGDFAQAYVIAHEVGHHVQNLLGTSRQIQSMRGKVSEEDYNKLSVRLELQADYFAGVWAHHAQRMKQILEEGDIEEAMQAANAIGDDTLQKRARGYVVPDSFTHGTSEQRQRWFLKGLQSGDISGGDTFNTRNL
ncbi:MAG: zinc metallopeptidase [Verrucomicrobiales bacterium]|nr:zinc metallopeptidase [Verrucomicrobiales bacterium]